MRRGTNERRKARKEEETSANVNWSTPPLRLTIPLMSPQVLDPRKRASALAYQALLGWLMLGLGSGRGR